MNASDLKVGNWVNFCNDPIQLTYKDLIYLLDMEQRGEQCASYSPANLTEEWLLKFGFEKCWPAPNQYAVEKLRVFFPPQFTKIPHPYCMLNGVVVEVPHVHQLQNLYFALTGQELEIKELA